MNLTEMAQASQLHYTVKNKFKKRDKALYENKFNGYKIDPSSDENVMGMYHNDKQHLHINHRGTSKPMDLLSDRLKLAGLERFDPQYNARRKHTKQMIKSYPDAKHVSLSGHSLAGDTVLQALHKSPSLAKHIDEVKIFNPFNVSKYEKDKDLHKKVEIHRTKSDLVSIIKQPYKTVVHNKDKIQQPLDAHGLHNFINETP